MVAKGQSAPKRPNVLGARLADFCKAPSPKKNKRRQRLVFLRPPMRLIELFGVPPMGDRATRPGVILDPYTAQANMTLKVRSSYRLRRHTATGFGQRVSCKGTDDPKTQFRPVVRMCCPYETGSPWHGPTPEAVWAGEVFSQRS